MKVKYIRAHISYSWVCSCFKTKSGTYSCKIASIYWQIYWQLHNCLMSQLGIQFPFSDNIIYGPPYWFIALLLKLSGCIKVLTRIKLKQCGQLGTNIAINLMVSTRIECGRLVSWATIRVRLDSCSSNK